LPFVIGREPAHVFVVVERGRRIDFVAGRTEFGSLQERSHHSAFVRGNDGEDLLVRELSIDRCAVFTREQGWAGDWVTAGAVKPRFGNRMTDRARYTLMIERREGSIRLSRFFGQRSGKERDRRVAGLTVSCEFYPARAQQNVCALSIER